MPTVSGASSFMRNNHEERASQRHLIERLKLAHLNLQFALERAKRMPMIEVSLLELRMIPKYVFEESRDLLYKRHTQQVNLEEQGVEQQVPLSPSLPNKIMQAVKPFFGTEKDSISGSCVRRFELFADKADKFVRDVESGCSLALYRFSCSLVTQLLEGKYLHYKMVNGSQTCRLSLFPYCLEDYGAVAIATLVSKDLKTPMKCFALRLMLRLSESMDIVGISTKCLQSLEPHFKYVADVASGELTQISTQVCSFGPELALRQLVFNVATVVSRSNRQQLLFCIGDVFQPSAKNFLSSEIKARFREQVSFLVFHCFIPAAEYNLQSSTVKINRNTRKAWSILQLSVVFTPHNLSKMEDDKVCTYLLTSREEFCGDLDCLDLSEIARLLPVQAIHNFEHEPGLTKYTVLSCSAHGYAAFTVSKPTTEMGCAPKIGAESIKEKAVEVTSDRDNLYA